MLVQGKGHASRQGSSMVQLPSTAALIAFFTVLAGTATLVTPVDAFAQAPLHEHRGVLQSSAFVATAPSSSLHMLLVPGRALASSDSGIRPFWGRCNTAFRSTNSPVGKRRLLSLKAEETDGQITVEVGKRAKAANSPEPAPTTSEKSKALARTVASWWKHHSKHRTIVPPEDLDVDYRRMLGDGTYGECFMGEMLGGPHKGAELVCKRAKDGVPDPYDPNWEEEDESERDEDREELALGYLNVEAYINDLVTDLVPERIAAPFLGMCNKGGKKWLVYEFLNGTTLEELMIECEECYSLAPLADALRVDDFYDDDPDSLRRLVNEVARQLFETCVALEEAGVAHRDIKPYNIFVTDGRLLLIDFGSAAAMGIRGRKGYDYNKSPCDPRYAPPEQFIEEEEWAKFDSYCVGLILVRILFTPLWGGQYFDSFSDAYHAAKYDLDAWLTRIILADRGLQERPKGFKLPMPFKKKEDVRDDEYVELAEASCTFPDDGSLLNMCNMKEGLEVLNIKEGGICWETLRMVLHKEPVTRMSARMALDRVLAAMKRDKKKAEQANGPRSRRLFLGLS